MKSHLRSCGAKVRNGKIKVAVDARGLPLKIITSDEILHDSQKAEYLIADE